MRATTEIIAPDADDPRARIEPFRRCVAFGIGRIIVTPGARAALAVTGETHDKYLVRHRTGRWNETPIGERERNVRATRSQRDSVLSHHHLKNGARLWLATTDDRSRTFIFTPEEVGEVIFTEREERAA